MPTLKERKRYLLFKGNKMISREEFLTKMKESFGDFGLAKSGLNLVLTKSNKGIVQVTHTYTDETQIALSLNDYDVLKISGILNKLKGGL